MFRGRIVESRWPACLLFQRSTLFENALHMRSLLTVVVFASFLWPLAWIGPAGAQTARPVAGQSLAQAERMSIDLKQGMTADDVQKLLGKPRRTTLKNNGGSATPLSQGTLQWMYTWAGSSSPASLSIDFVA